MLEQMREAGLAGLLVARAHPVKNLEGRDRRLVVLQHQNLEPVGQRLGFDIIGDTRTGSARERDRKGERAKIQYGCGFDSKMVKHGV